MDIKQEVQKDVPEERPSKTCIVCGNEAEYCIRGLPKDSYCRECAKDYFKFLSYLDKLSSKHK